MPAVSRAHVSSPLGCNHAFLPCSLNLGVPCPAWFGAPGAGACGLMPLWRVCIVTGIGIVRQAGFSERRPAGSSVLALC